MSVGFKTIEKRLASNVFVAQIPPVGGKPSSSL